MNISELKQGRDYCVCPPAGQPVDSYKQVVEIKVQTAESVWSTLYVYFFVRVERPVIEEICASVVQQNFPNATNYDTNCK